MNIQSSFKLKGFIQGPNAFIYYSPGPGKKKQKIFFNPEAWRILSLTALPSSRGMDSPPDLSSICGLWCKKLNEKIQDSREAGAGSKTGVFFLDVYQSRRRLYAILGVVLQDRPSSKREKGGQCLFVLERVSSEGMYLSLIGRQWKLSPREKELVRLLLSDKSNKEIAHALALKENTVKGYMKLLMRRLGVGSRTGIVSQLLIGSGGHPLEDPLPRRGKR